MYQKKQHDDKTNKTFYIALKCAIISKVVGFFKKTFIICFQKSFFQEMLEGESS